MPCGAGRSRQTGPAGHVLWGRSAQRETGMPFRGVMRAVDPARGEAARERGRGNREREGEIEGGRGRARGREGGRDR